LQNVFELVVLADACVCGVHFEEVLDLAARGARRATHFPHSPRYARCASRGERCYPRALQSTTTRHSLWPTQAPGPLPRHPLSAAEACVRKLKDRNASSVPHYLPPASRRPTLHRQAPNPKSAIGREEYIDTWCEGVHDLLMRTVAIFLERRSSFPQNISRYTRSCLHVPHICFHAYSMRSTWPCHDFPT
jgi:hypothetical protein